MDAKGPARPRGLRALCVPFASFALNRIFSRLIAVEEGDEEAVGAVLRRGQAEIVAFRGRGAADGLRPGARGGVEREIAMRVEKGLGLCLVLLAQQRAGDVDEAAAGLHEARGAVEDRALALDELGEIGRGRAPFGVGIAAPAADPETRRVDKHAVETLLVVLDPGIALGRQRAALDIVDAGAAQALAGALQAPFRRVAGDELAAVLHRGSERQ